MSTKIITPKCCWQKFFYQNAPNKVMPQPKCSFNQQSIAKILYHKAPAKMIFSTKMLLPIYFEMNSFTPV